MTYIHFLWTFHKHIESDVARCLGKATTNSCLRLTSSPCIVSNDYFIWWIQLSPPFPPRKVPAPNLTLSAGRATSEFLGKCVTWEGSVPIPVPEALKELSCKPYKCLTSSHPPRQAVVQNSFSKDTGADVPVIRRLPTWEQVLKAFNLV